MTAIQWTDETWNPLVGCSRVSSGCVNCYAERQAYRNAAMGISRYDGLTHKVGGEVRWTGVVRLVHEALDKPLRWRRPRKVFVNSMSDLFHEAGSADDVAAIFAIMALAGSSPCGSVRGHTFQVLTKRADNLAMLRSDKFRLSVADYVMSAAESYPDLHATRGRWSQDVRDGIRNDRAWWPLPSVWLGVSVEDQATADARIPRLLETPARVRFVSYEPALGPVDFGHFLCRDYSAGRLTIGCYLDWIIVGGESGPGARPFDLVWAWSTIRQCRDVGVAVFFKQAGARPILSRLPAWHEDGWGQADLQLSGAEGLRVNRWNVHLRDPKGGDPEEWPTGLRVRDFPILKGA